MTAGSGPPLSVKGVYDVYMCGNKSNLRKLA